MHGESDRKVSRQAVGNALAGVVFLIVAIVDFTRDSSGIGVVFLVFAAVFLGLGLSGRKPQRLRTSSASPASIPGLCLVVPRVMRSRTPGIACSCAASRMASGATRTTLCFRGKFGEPESPNGWLKREFYPALKRARVEYFRFHDLRHFAVSQLIAQGANILELARVAGHADPSITLRVYSHLMDDALSEAADRYDPLRTFAVDAR